MSNIQIAQAKDKAYYDKKHAISKVTAIFICMILTYIFDLHILSNGTQVFLKNSARETKKRRQIETKVEWSILSTCRSWKGCVSFIQSKDRKNSEECSQCISTNMQSFILQINLHHSFISFAIS